MAFTQFDRVPNHYAGHIIQSVKDFRESSRALKKELGPTLLQVGQLEILIPRHFGFCFGVERAIHMAFSAYEQNPDKRIHLVSEIIHNPLVNNDLKERGISFIYDSAGKRQIPETEMDREDIVLIPAFGTTLEIEESLKRSGVDTNSEEFREHYDTTCPFVSKVWNRGESLGLEGYTIIIHGKFRHEETQATHSHTKEHTKTLVVLGCDEAQMVHDFIIGDMDLATFRQIFEGKWSEDFDPERDLERVAVVNQTTMLAEETQQVAAIMRQAMERRYGGENLEYHFADTRDTLCYATNQNQNATKALLKSQADLALVVGGYNSSNTSHLVEICDQVMPSYLIKSADELLDAERIQHFDIVTKETRITTQWLPLQEPVRLAVTSGASCPDTLMNQVIERLVSFYGYGEQEIQTGLNRLRIVEELPVGEAP